MKHSYFICIALAGLIFSVGCEPKTKSERKKEFGDFVTKSLEQSSVQPVKIFSLSVDPIGHPASVLIQFIEKNPPVDIFVLSEVPNSVADELTATYQNSPHQYRILKGNQQPGTCTCMLSRLKAVQVEDIHKREDTQSIVPFGCEGMPLAKLTKRIGDHKFVLAQAELGNDADERARQLNGLKQFGKDRKAPVLVLTHFSSELSARSRDADCKEFTDNEVWQILKPENSLAESSAEALKVSETSRVFLAGPREGWQIDLHWQEQSHARQGTPNQVTNFRFQEIVLKGPKVRYDFVPLEPKEN